jgi:hypothetical protein
LSPSANLAVTSSGIGGSMVFSAANIHLIGRAPRIGNVQEQSRMVVGDVATNRAGLE